MPVEWTFHGHVLSGEIELLSAQRHQEQAFPRDIPTRGILGRADVAQPNDLPIPAALQSTEITGFLERSVFPDSSSAVAMRGLIKI